MKIAVIGANGRAGSRILAEAEARGHEVTAIVRNKSKLTDKSVKIIESDLFALTAADLAPFDTVVNAFGDFTATNNIFLESGKYLTALLKNSNTPYLIVVGGAGSLFVGDDKVPLYTTPDFPKEYYRVASAMAAELDFLKTVKDVNWTFLSPAAEFAPGERTGQFRLGKDRLIIDEEGKSSISMEDYAIAVLDEAENPRHVKEQFTIGY
jgi:putative NADH-flavin reductase